MKIAFFSTKAYDEKSFEKSEKSKYEITFFKQEISIELCQRLDGFEAICVFVNDKVDESKITVLKQKGIKLILLRCAGFDNVDLKVAKKEGMKVYRVPQYSPYAVAEFAVGLMLALNRKIHKAYNRTRDNNFALEGLLGFDMNGKTVGVVGTGAIGAIVVRIMKAFGCKVIAYDVYKNDKLIQELNLEYVELDKLFEQSDIISLHAPLMKETTHMVNEAAISKMKDGVMIINTSRGPLIDTKAVIRGLKTKKIGAIGMDVYENESNLYFSDHSSEALEDDILARITGFPNVLVTGHQAFFTKEALDNIRKFTLQNVDDFLEGKDTNECTKTLKD